MGQSTIPTHARSRGGHVVRTLPGKFTYSIPGKVGLEPSPLENKIKLYVGTPPPPHHPTTPSGEKNSGSAHATCIY